MKSHARWSLILIWCLFLLKGTFYCVLFPLWEGYDEFAHFAFIEHLSTRGELPDPSQRVSKEVQKSLFLAPLPRTLEHWPEPHVTHDGYWQLPAAERKRRESELRNLKPAVTYQPGTEFLYEGKQPPLYYWLLSWMFAGVQQLSIVDIAFLLRLASILIASAVIPIAFLTGKSIFTSDATGVQIAALTGAFPELYIDVARVGNESLAIVLFSLLAYFSLRVVDRTASIIWPALFLGLGLLTKAYFLTAIPFIAVLALSTTLRCENRRAAILRCAAAGSLILAVAGWWYYRNTVLANSGLWIDAAPSREMGVWEIARNIVAVDWITAVRSVFLSHIWFGNWSFLQVRNWMYQFFEVIVLVSIVGLLIRPYRRETAVKVRDSHVAILVGLYGFFLLGIAYHVLMNFINSSISSSSGWYLYAVVVPEVLLVAIGLFSVLPRNWIPFVLPAATIGLSLLELYTVHFQLLPYYTGFIAHGPTGGLRSFYVTQWAHGGSYAMLSRILTNRPTYLTEELVEVLWVLFILATAGMVLVGFCHSCRRPSKPNG